MRALKLLAVGAGLIVALVGVIVISVYHVEYPALIRAARDGDADRVHRLLADGADPNERNFQGTTAIDVALGAHVPSSPFDTSQKPWPGIDLRVREPNIEILELLLAAGGKPTAPDLFGWNSWYLVSNRPDMLKFLDEHAMIGDFDVRLLAGAASSWDVDTCAMLLSRGTRQISGEWEQMPIHVATEGPCQRIGWCCYGPPWDGGPQDQFATLELLLSHGAGPNTPDDNGNTPLHLVAQLATGDRHCRNNDPKLIAWLLGNGADPRIRNAAGCTPLETLEEARTYSSAQPEGHSPCMKEARELLVTAVNRLKP